MKLNSFSPLFFAALLCLATLVGCQSEPDSTGNSAPLDSLPAENAIQPPNAPVLGSRYSWKMEPGFSWKVKSLETTTVILNPGTGNESRSATNVTINRKASFQEMDKEMALNIQMVYQDVVSQKGEGGKPTKGKVPASDGGDPRLGKSLSLRLEPKTGQVLEVKGAESIFAAGGLQAHADLADAVYREIMNDEMYLYPDGPIEVGDSWQRTGMLRLPYGLKASHTYTLDKEMNKQGFIKRVTKLEEGNKLPGQEVSYALAGTETADYNVDEATGLVFSKVSSTTLEGSMTKGGKTTPVRIEISSITEMTLE